MLHEEEVVTEKRTVPKERVRLTKDTVTDEEIVSADIRKERDRGRRRSLGGTRRRVRQAPPPVLVLVARAT